MLNIGGFKASTLVNYPGRAAAVVFTNGCNMRCAYCHNGNLALGKEPTISEEEILNKLRRNLRFCKNVVISGGEPSIQTKDVFNFCEKLKEIGIERIKLDTNGTSSEIICSLAHNKLIDYVAMDIKSKEHFYDRRVQKTIQHLYQIRNKMQNTDKFDFEFRTTLDKGYITHEDIRTILDTLCRNYITYFDEFDNCCSPAWYFQECNLPETQLLSVDKKVEPYTKDDLIKLARLHLDYCPANGLKIPVCVVRRFFF